MKRFLILAVALMCIVPFASGLVLNNRGTLQGNVVGGDNLSVDVSRADLCSAYGLTPYMGQTDMNFYLMDSTPLPPTADIPLDLVWQTPQDTYYPSMQATMPLNQSGGAYVVLGESCSDVKFYGLSYWTYYGYPGAAPAPIANFTGSPLNATAPEYVAFTDTSENEYGTCTYNWSFTPSTGVLVAPQDLDNEDITMLFTENGDFTITHGVSCAAGSNISTKTDYIHIFNATALSTFRVRAVDMLSGYGVNGAQVDVFDIENSSWNNQTSVTGEVTVTALTGHNINAYGSATGYDDGESLGLPVVAGSLYPIYMRPTDLPGNVSAGNVTLYLTLLEDGTNTRLSGYAVSLTGPSSGGADYTAGVTDDNGVFTAVVKNQTNYNVKVLAQKGHLGANKNFNSGIQSGGDSYVEVTMWLGVNTVTTAPTVTTLPGGGTPTPTTTYLANCDPKASDYDAAKCRSSKGGFGLNILADNLEWLIYLCLIVTAVYLLKGMGKR